MKIFIGWDHRQPVAFTVAQLSILDKASKPFSITPLVLDTLPITRQGLTPFTYSRFLVPWLCGYEGKALFIDSDFLCRSDLTELLECENQVSVVHHKGARSFERSSLMLFNCAKCKILTPEYVQTQKLHGLEWANDVGSLETSWNHLVGYDDPNPSAKMVHFTQGLPVYDRPELHDQEFGNEWRAFMRAAVSVAPWEVLMGNSVHAPYVEERKS